MALIAHTSIPSTSSYGSTSPNVDTTGVKFIAAVVGAYTNGSLTSPNLTFIDNKGNTYTGRTIYNGTVPWCRIFYCNNPTVGAGHNWGFGGGQPYYPSACIAGFDDTVTGFDVENGGVSSGTQTSKATGSVTPTTSNSLVIAGFNPCDNGAGTITVNGSFTITDQVVWASGQREGSALAYLYTTATSALNPTFTIPTASTQGLGAAIAVFKLASSGSTLSASGTGAASFVGASTAATTLTSAGAGALSAVGASTAATTLTASGAGALTGIGASKAYATLTASGAGTFTGVGASTASTTLTSAGTGSFSAVGASLASAVATMAGAATASFVGAVASAGSTLVAAGTSAFSAVGASLASAVATFAGTSTASFIGADTASTFTAHGSATVSFLGKAPAPPPAPPASSPATGNSSASSLKLPRISNQMTVTQDPASRTFSRFWDKAMGSIEVAFNGNTSLSSQVTGVAHRDSDNAYVANNLFYQTPNSILGYQVAGTQVVGPQVMGWTAGTGTKSLGAFNADATRTIGGSYSQTDVQGIQDDLKTARQRILALETAMRSHGLIN